MSLLQRKAIKKIKRIIKYPVTMALYLCLHFKTFYVYMIIGLILEFFLAKISEYLLVIMGNIALVCLCI